ncbi:MAG: TspO/MBR family protein [Methanosarcina sp.]
MFHRANLLKLLASVLLCQLAGAIGSAFTASSLGNAVSLKTGFQPPSGVFILVWITLYTIRGIFLYLFCKKGLEQQKIKGELVIFGIQSGLNALWSFLFLGKNLLTMLLLRSFCSGLQSF